MIASFTFFSSKQLWHSKINSTFFSYSKYASGLFFPWYGGIFIFIFPRFLSISSCHLWFLRKPLPRLSPFGTDMPSWSLILFIFELILVVVIRIIHVHMPFLPSSIWDSLGMLLMQSINNNVLPIHLILNLIKHHIHAFKLLLHSLQHEGRLLPSFFVWCVAPRRHIFETIEKC